MRAATGGGRAGARIAGARGESRNPPDARREPRRRRRRAAGNEKPAKYKLMITKAYATPLVLLGAIIALVRDELSSPLLRQTLRKSTRHVVKMYIPQSLDLDSQRRRSNSINLGGGACQWQPPTYDVPEELDLHKTFIAGFPSGDKRMAYIQMEALAGLSAKDEWDFARIGMSNHPFIKGNYPHHEGIWGWGTAADQVILMVPNIRRSMVEYHDILWDLGYVTTWEDATLLSDNLFGQQPPLDDYYEWRDSRVQDEVQRYGWFIDYWMEGGLQRDIFTHNMINHENWMNLMNRPFFTREELRWEEDDFVTEPSYDPHCAHGDISGGCVPV